MIQGVNFINILCLHFLYVNKLSSFSLLRVWLWTNFRTKNVLVKCWWNWLKVDTFFKSTENIETANWPKNIYFNWILSLILLTISLMLQIIFNFLISKWSLIVKSKLSKYKLLKLHILSDLFPVWHSPELRLFWDSKRTAPRQANAEHLST